MAEVLGALNPEDEQRFMTMRELYSRTQAEVYEAAGEEIFTSMSLLGEEFPGRGCYLLQLRDGRQVAFPFVLGKIEEPSQ